VCEPGGTGRSACELRRQSGVISPIWSLRWEVLFSLLLPLFVIFAVTLPRP